MPDRVVAGIGASSSATTAQCIDALTSLLGSEWALVGVATLDAKAEAIGPVADAFGVPLTVWTAAELDRIQVPNPSSRVRREVGSGSIAEAAAILGSGGGRIVVPKTNVGRVSIACACAAD